MDNFEKILKSLKENLKKIRAKIVKSKPKPRVRAKKKDLNPSKKRECSQRGLSCCYDRCAEES